MMKETDLIPRLISEFGYPSKGAQIIAGKLINCSLEIQNAFLMFWKTGEIPSLEIAGYSISRLKEEHGMNPIAALLTLDWLVRDPKEATRSLSKGHDIVAKRTLH